MVVGNTADSLTATPEFGGTPGLEDPTLVLLNLILRLVSDWLGEQHWNKHTTEGRGIGAWWRSTRSGGNSSTAGGAVAKSTRTVGNSKITGSARAHGG